MDNNHVNENTEELILKSSKARQSNSIKIGIIAAVAVFVIAGILVGFNISKNNKYEKQLQLGVMSFREGDYETAEAMFTSAIGMKSRDTRAREALAYTYAASGNHARAAEVYRELADMAKSDNEKKMYGMAQGLADTGEFPAFLNTIEMNRTYSYEWAEEYKNILRDPRRAVNTEEYQALLDAGLVDENEAFSEYLLIQEDGDAVPRLIIISNGRKCVIEVRRTADGTVIKLIPIGEIDENLNGMIENGTLTALDDQGPIENYYSDYTREVPLLGGVTDNGGADAEPAAYEYNNAGNVANGGQWASDGELMYGFDFAETDDEFEFMPVLAKYDDSDGLSIIDTIYSGSPDAYYTSLNYYDGLLYFLDQAYDENGHLTRIIAIDPKTGEVVKEITIDYPYAQDLMVANGRLYYIVQNDSWDDDFWGALISTDLDGGDEKTLFEQSDDTLKYTVAGDYVYILGVPYDEAGEGAAALSEYSLYRVAPDGSGLTVVADNVMEDSYGETVFPRLIPSGGKIYVLMECYTGDSFDMSWSGIKVFDETTGDLAQMDIDFGGFGCFNVSGEYLYYLKYKGDNTYDVMRYNLRTGANETLGEAGYSAGGLYPFEKCLLVDNEKDADQIIMYP